MKRHLKLFVVCALSFLALSSCKMSEEELTETVKQSMVEEYSKKGIEVVDLSKLIHKGGNEYIGIVTFRENGKEKKMHVDVVYDYDSSHDYFHWSTKE